MKLPTVVQKTKVKRETNKLLARRNQNDLDCQAVNLLHADQIKQQRFGSSLV